MITIEKAQKKLEQLWGKQSVKPNCSYRLMKYVYQVELDDHVILHNMVTGQLVLLEQFEADLLSRLPHPYSQELVALIETHFLVPEEYDEHRQVLNLRTILRKLASIPKKDITSYTILPTTACNARCYYCFEAGVKNTTMTEQTADDVIEYISNHCGKAQHIFLSWFGGEPTISANRISQICQGLLNKGISYTSDITTNGYLLDKEMIAVAKDLWHLKTVKISVDGVEDNYNKAKRYVNPQENPYKRILNNIALLLENEIYVRIRMNFDIKNITDFNALIQDINTLFPQNPYISLRAHPIIGEHKDYDGELNHGTSAWFNSKIVELHNISRAAGLYRKKDFLPFLSYKGCQASSDSAVTITPEGNLVCCPEQFGTDQTIGTIYEDITNINLRNSWKVFSDYEICQGCVFYPRCQRLKNCGAKDRCDYKLEYQNQIKLSIFERTTTFLATNI